MNELITTRPIEIEVSNYCGSCGHRMNRGDNFCRQCGVDCRALVIEPVSPHNPQGNHQSTEVATIGLPEGVQQIVDNRIVVTGLLAFTGPLGLLALWFSRRIKKRTKIFVTASYILLAIVLPIVVTWYWLDVALRPIVDLFSK